METHKVNRLTGFLICVILLCIATGFPGSATGAEIPSQESRTIVFTTIYLPNMASFYKMSEIYKEAFRRLGYDFRLIHQPGERAMVDANQGIVDGEAARIMNIDRQKYANLIMVPYPIAEVSDGAYSTNHSIVINGYESLAGKPYKVGLLKGIKAVEEKLPLYVDKRNIIELTSLEQCLKMSQAGRIDLFIVSTQIEESTFMRGEAYKEVKLVGIVETKVLYPWLHKRHHDLVQPLADTLENMKSKGWF